MAGLPKAMIEKREAMRAKQQPEVMHREEPQNNVVIPIEPGKGPVAELHIPEALPPVVEPTPAPSPQNQWEEEARKWEQRYRSLQGKIESLDPELRSEKEKVSNLERALQELREAMPRSAPTPDPDVELTEDEAKVYGDSSPVIQKIARKIARGELNEALKDLRREITELREANTRVQTDLTNMSDAQFYQYVRGQVPNFDDIVSHAEWAGYLDTKVPYSKLKLAQALEQAHKGRDLESVKEILTGFKPSKNPLASMVSPPMNGGGAAPLNSSGDPKKPTLKWSDRVRMSEDKRMGRVKSKEQIASWDAWDKAFREAEAEGRIDYSK